MDHPQTPVEELTLTLAGLRGATGVQLELLPDVRRDRHQRLVEVEKGLQARTRGRQVLFRALNVAPWHPVPEMRALQIPIDAAEKGEIRPLALPTPVAVQEGRGPSTAGAAPGETLVAGHGDRRAVVLRSLVAAAAPHPQLLSHLQ